MQEDFLHYIWKFQKFETLNLHTTDGEAISIINVGQHNLDSGPDFFNAQVRIAEQLWAGNVEVHINSSDWYIHNHQTDSAYENVILHVVYNHDMDIYRKDNSLLPTFVLSQYIDKNLQNRYYNLISRASSYINCEKDIGSVDAILISHWFERMYIERLEKKSKFIIELLESSNNDWEAVFFKMLSKNFGLKVNGDSFLSMAQSIDFSIIRQISDDNFKLEAVFFGLLNMFSDENENAYSSSLNKEYNFLSKKYNLRNDHIIPIKFFRLRPINFPTIRLAQLAAVYHKNQGFFSKIMNAVSLDGIYKLFNIKPSNYWKNHYNFKTESKPSNKRLSKAFIDLLIINTIIPVKFCYLRNSGSADYSTVMELALNMESEKNSIVEKFYHLIKLEKSAFNSQSIIQLKTLYCDRNRCLNCEIGNFLLKS